MALSPNEELPKILRDLADALERRNAVRELRDMEQPYEIRFMDHGVPLTDPLSVAIKKEISISWVDLRARALSRIEDSVGQLSHQINCMLGKDG